MKYLLLLLFTISLVSIGTFSFAEILAYELFATDVILINDFEAEDYGDWVVTGEVFGPGPAEGALPNQGEVTGYKGNRLVTSFYGGDSTTGTLTSPAFTIERNYINFLIGGGGHAGRTCMNLLHQGQVVRTATGPNLVRGGTEHLDWHSWDVSDLKGRTVQLQIVDDHRGTWGHINVDHIYQSNHKRQLPEKTSSFIAENRYLNLPVKNGNPSRLMHLMHDGQYITEFTIELATEEPDFWVFIDISQFQGQELKLWIDHYDSQWQSGFDAIHQADTFPGYDHLYQEKLRPQFHFSAARGWLNDTNGMVYHDGKFHMFFQHNPYSWNWRNMSWGHAVSTDLIHWEQLPVALHPDELGTIYSGSAVVDENNSAGFQSGDEKPLVAIYTSAGGENPLSSGKPFTQSIAYSNDAGLTWQKYRENPVIEAIAPGTRDPKVIWHEPTEQWVMVLYIQGQTLSFFTSDDLKQWQRHGDIDGFYECPELFELPVNGDESNTKWVLYGANGYYYIGDFDGYSFQPQTSIIRYQYGNCFYASQTFNNVPESDGRRIQIAFGRDLAMPGMPFNQMMLFPVSLTLHTTSDGIRMYANPVKEIAKLHGRHWEWFDEAVQVGENPLSSVSGELFHVNLTLKPWNAQFCKLIVRGIPIVYDVASEQLTCQGRSAPVSMKDGKISLQILVDRMTIEIFANDGQIYMPIGVNLTDGPTSLELKSEGGSMRIEKADVYELNSIWF